MVDERGKSRVTGLPNGGPNPSPATIDGSPYDSIVILPLYLVAAFALISACVLRLGDRGDHGAVTIANLVACSLFCICMATILALRVRVKTLADRVAKLESSIGALKAATAE